MKLLKIIQKKSAIGRVIKHRRTLHGLGLRYIGHHVIREKNQSIIGMINKISYMVKVEEII
ncbi:50S ribosomal protein L30 [Buchnera aphidicola (Thelaxes suberi)]|uniref:50S ribosomal protein L30 n=1 Tax=Buchnera aphidicola TaxID=9 RepID=UPI00346400B4